MRKIKYIYNYPENREIGKQLSWRDCTRIASKTGYSADFVYRCLKLGTRTNEKIKKTALRLISLYNKL